MALVTPLFLALIFASCEGANYMWNAHIVAKAARDGARYASRRSFDDYAGCVPSTAAVTAARNVARTGRESGGTALLSNWTDPATITVTASCAATGTYRGVYEQLTTMGPPRVTVTVAVPYASLFGGLGFGTTGLMLRARSQAAVAGS
jgi:Flp pilus assembly protein TadG